MKLVIALIRPEQLPDVKRALFAAQIRHLTATMTLGTAPKSEQQKFRGVEREVSLFQRVRVEVAVTTTSSGSSWWEISKVNFREARVLPLTAAGSMPSFRG